MADTEGSSDRNNFARLMNSTMTHSATPIEPLYDLQNHLIHNFPPTAALVRAITGKHLTKALQKVYLINLNMFRV